MHSFTAEVYVYTRKDLNDEFEEEIFSSSSMINKISLRPRRIKYYELGTQLPNDFRCKLAITSPDARRSIDCFKNFQCCSSLMRPRFRNCPNRQAKSKFPSGPRCALILKLAIDVHDGVKNAPLSKEKLWEYQRLLISWSRNTGIRGATAGGMRIVQNGLWVYIAMDHIPLVSIAS